MHLIAAFDLDISFSMCSMDTSFSMCSVNDGLEWFWMEVFTRIYTIPTENKGYRRRPLVLISTLSVTEFLI